MSEEDEMADRDSSRGSRDGRGEDGGRMRCETSNEYRVGGVALDSWPSIEGYEGVDQLGRR